MWPITQIFSDASLIWLHFLFLFAFNFWWAYALSSDGMVICSSVILCITFQNKGVYSVQTQITLTFKNTSHPKQHTEYLMKQLTVILWSFLLITKVDVILIASVSSAWSVFWRAHDLKFCKTATLLKIHHKMIWITHFAFLDDLWLLLPYTFQLLYYMNE